MQPILNPMYPQTGTQSMAEQMPQDRNPVLTTVVTQTISPTFGPFPVPIKCPHCLNAGISEVVYVSGLATYLLCGGCCLLGLWLCCCIPFCLNSAKDAHHYCPNCRSFLGRYKKVGS